MRSGAVIRSFDVPGSVKDMIEASGVPHTEIDLIIANGRSVDFSYRVQDGDRIGVFPVFESLDIAPITRVRPERLAEARFVADCHLGRLARFLRLLGFDTRYDRTWADRRLVSISTAEERMLLTRDVGLLKHGSLTHGYFVRATDPMEQMIEVVLRFRLSHQIVPFTRCMVCNGALVAVAKDEIAPQVPPETRRNIATFRRCASCGKVYWRGAHHPELRRIVAAARGVGRATPNPAIDDPQDAPIGDSRRRP